MHTFEQLARSAIHGDKDAWARLQLEALPRIEAFLRGHKSMRSRGLHLLPDDVQEVKTTTLERLARNDFQNLRRYVEQLERSAQAAQGFESWLYGAVDFTIREHLRRRYGRASKVRHSEAGVPLPSKRDANTYAGSLSDASVPRAMAQTLGITTNLTAAEIMAYVAATFTPMEAAAVRMHYLEDRDFDQIATALQMESSKEAEKLVRRLNARLRYRFAPSEAGVGRPAVR